jgi:hypothetical protein
MCPPERIKFEARPPDHPETFTATAAFFLSWMLAHSRIDR